MPHSTRDSSLNRANFKFPRTSMEQFPDMVESPAGLSPYPSSPNVSSNPTNAMADRWPPRKDSALRGPNWAGQSSTGAGHGRQKSLSDAFRTIRTRKASVSANVHEIGDALKAPVSPKLVVW